MHAVKFCVLLFLFLPQEAQVDVVMSAGRSHRAGMLPRVGVRSARQPTV